MGGLIVDNFAGGGGASTGIEAALGREVDVAINHDPEAVAMHTANHPDTRHFCQSIMAIDPREACSVDGQLQKVDLAWFSPDCKHHSKAKGGKPREKNIRDLAWVVVHWPERLGEYAPDVMMLENVEEFRKWGPLDENGQPIKEREGEEFDLWVRRIKRCGYKVEWRELVASDYGAPTTRKRLYLIARRDGKPIVWPEPTHGKPGSAAVESGALEPWRTAASCIDWSIACPSIFDRTKPLKPNTLRRIAHGTMRYVVENPSPFIVPVTNSQWNPSRTWSADEPLRTVTTAKGGEYAVAVPHVTKFRGGAIGSDAGDPMPTVTANGEPARPAGAQPLGLASATLVQTGYGEREGQQPRALDPQAPLGTVVAAGGKHAAVTAFLSQYYGEKENGRVRAAAAISDPLRTQSTANRFGLVCAHIEQANTGMVGHPMGRPLSTIVGKGCTQRLVQTTLIEQGDLPPDLMERATRTAAFLIKYYGSDQAPELDEPLHTVTTRDRFAVVTVKIDAATYVLVDIGMRMLTPRELARAQGLPGSYVLDPVVTKTFANGRTKTRPLTKSEQIRMIGNMVCPDVAEALVRANLGAVQSETESRAA